MKIRITHLLWGGICGTASVAAVLLAWKVVRADVAAEVYKERLGALATDYRQLESLYNSAVSRSAVTELIVADGALSVRVRTPLGTLKEIQTPFDPRIEIYVDYVVIDGRVWIRRIFDQNTPPSQGIVIDPGVAEIDWEANDAGHGKAVYRALSDGRWVVTVTGSGALGLRRADGPEPIVLAPAPEIRDYDEVREDVDRKVASVGWRDILSRIVGSPEQ